MQHPLMEIFKPTAEMPIVPIPSDPTLEDFRAFTAAQPPDQPYFYSDSRGCAVGQFAQSVGMERWIGKATPVHAQRRGTYDGEVTDFWRTANQLAGNGPKTFGALTERIDQRFKTNEVEPILLPAKTDG